MNLWGGRPKKWVVGTVRLLNMFGRESKGVQEDEQALLKADIEEQRVLTAYQDNKFRNQDKGV